MRVPLRDPCILESLAICHLSVFIIFFLSFLSLSIFRSVKRAFVEGVLSLVYCALEEHGRSIWDVHLELEIFSSLLCAILPLQ